MLKKILILFPLTLSLAQEIFTEYLVEDHDTIDVFSYQLPELYNDSISHPLIIAFHQWGGNEGSTYNTQFDEEANSREWIFMSPYGGSSNNYNHQGAQKMVKDEILWLMENYLEKERSMADIADQFGITPTAIHQWLLKHDIPTRSKGRKKHDN